MVLQRIVAVDTLVFSGGGARGIAHVGALVGLRDAYGVDWGLGAPRRLRSLAGTSIGAAVAMLLALGASVDFVRREALSLQLADVASVMSLQGLMMGTPCTNDGTALRRRIAQAIRRLGRDPRTLILKDLAPVTLAVVATDNFTGQKVVLSSTDPATRDVRVVDAVYASMAIPPVLAPLYACVGGKVCELVDGGFTDNFPVDVIDNPARALAFRVSGSSDFPTGHDPLSFYQRLMQTCLRSFRQARDARPAARRVRVVDVAVNDIGSLDMDVPRAVQERVMRRAALEAVAAVERPDLTPRDEVLARVTGLVFAILVFRYVRGRAARAMAEGVAAMCRRSLFRREKSFVASSTSSTETKQGHN